MNNINSLKRNMMLNSVKTIMALLFPLITFPYASRVLHVVNIGKVNYAVSIASYFILLANLGIVNYSIREGSKVRDNHEKISKLSSEIFTISLISSLVSFLLFYCTYLMFDQLHSYKWLLLIQSIPVIINAFSFDWLFTIYENYFFITVRSIIIQLVSIVLLILLVHTPGDIYIYSLIMVFSIVGGYIFNYLKAKKYCDIKICISKTLLTHMKPIMILFGSVVAIQLYVNTDTTILGIFSGDYYVGIYSVSVKMYSMVKNIIVAATTVTIPRLAFLIGHGRHDEYQELLKSLLNQSLVLIIPAMVGVIFVGGDIVNILFGQEYLRATSSLSILSLAIMFSCFGLILNTGLLILHGKEKLTLKITLLSGLVNLVLNIILIPIWNENAAAFTTLISEFIVFYFIYRASKQLENIGFDKKNIIEIAIASLSIAVICLLSDAFLSSVLLRTSFSMITSIIVYFFILYKLKNQYAVAYFEGIKKRLSFSKKTEEDL